MKTTVLTGHQRPITFVQYNPDGDLLFSSGKDGYLNCWLVKCKKRLGRYNTGKAMVTNCDVTYDSQKLLAASADSKVFVFEVQTGREFFSASENGPVKFAEWNRKPGHQDRFVLLQDGFAGRIKPAIKVYVRNEEKYDVNSPEKYEVILQIADFKNPCTRVHWGPFDETLISAHDNGEIMIWDAESGECLKSFKAHDRNISDMAFTDNRLFMLTSSPDCSGKLWDTVEFRNLKTYQTDRPLNSCAISPLWNDKENPYPHVIFGGGQSAIDVTTTGASEGKFQALFYHMIYGNLLASVTGHYSPINSLTFQPDGMGICTGAEEGNIRVYEFDDEYFKKLASQ